MILLYSIISLPIFVDVDGIIKAIQEFGIINGILILLVGGIFFILVKRAESSYRDLLDGKQSEIDALAVENKHYRETFFEFMKLNGITPPPKKGKGPEK